MQRDTAILSGTKALAMRWKIPLNILILLMLVAAARIAYESYTEYSRVRNYMQLYEKAKEAVKAETNETQKENQNTFEQNPDNKEDDIKIIEQTVSKKGVEKIDYLFKNKDVALNWARKKLGFKTQKMYSDKGELIGWKNDAGDMVYWNHNDWGKGLGKSTYPHLNYSIGKQKGHLFLKDKIENRKQWVEFIKYFNL